MICDECMHLKKELTDKCRCTEGKIIGVMYIGMVDGCIFYDSNNNKRCKKPCVYDDENEFTLFSCIKHIKKDKKKDKKKESVKANDTETNISIKKRGKKKMNFI